MTRRSLILAMLACGLSVGCGGTSGPVKVTVTGEVTLDGELLDSGLISFIPPDGKGATAGAPIEPAARVTTRWMCPRVRRRACWW